MFPLHMTASSSFEIEEALLKLSLMCQQEERAYNRVDYFVQHHDNDAQNSLKEIDIDYNARNQMMVWCYQVIDFCQLSHNSVELAMNYLDRFMMTQYGQDALYDRNIYQLACMTSLYTIVKVHEPTCMNPALLCKLSQGLYTEQHFIKMESMMLNAVQWKVNAPSTAVFIDMLLKLLPTTIDHVEIIRKHATEQAECLLRESSFISTKASVIAYCSLVSVLHSMNTINPTIATQLAISVNITTVTDEIMLIQKHLSSGPTLQIQEQKCCNNKNNKNTMNVVTHEEENLIIQSSSKKNVSNNYQMSPQQVAIE